MHFSIFFNLSHIGVLQQQNYNIMAWGVLKWGAAARFLSYNGKALRGA